ncbi:MAG TPA: SIMPL domain-containing protein [Sphingomonadaceae bacterium]|jgi:uncharacterized protein YggE|nr:SIMPL domain-containing protein [Sphingomonadaceae bacterium]
MRRLALLLLLASAPAAAQVPQIDISSDAPVIGIAVVESVQSSPDLALFQVGVSTTGPTATAALAENARKMDNVIARIRSAGVAARDIQTSGISVHPQYSERGRDPASRYEAPRIVGYNASNGVTVRYRKLGEVGALLDALVAAGANNINGPSFTIEDPAARIAEARDKAIAAAQVRANDYARKLGMRGTRLLSITEGAGGRDYGNEIVVTGSRIMNVQAEMAPPPAMSPVEPGQIATRVSMFVQYALTR